MMKKIITLLSVGMFIFSVSAQADQPAVSQRRKCDDERCQTMMQLKRTFMEENFKLTDTVQGRKFWDSYTRLEKSEFEVHGLQQKLKAEAGLPAHIRSTALDTLPEEQILAFYRIKFKIRDQKSKAENIFFEDLCDCLSPRQINRYYQLEKEFKRSAVNKEAHKRFSGKAIPVAPAQQLKK